ncbi:hypothetical protein BpHYR1_020666 [Brachionus plicatilis]|uniref:SWIM-type domain-containing protein n=1 Tax=Brachionus plicatilis TaxID=10195 RepID=A0A3M7T712_BRAPC|nr:hypothetical protein BpHYR1_020666 [Brachionus plicatilis]
MVDSCRWYIKNYICKHLIGISKILNIPGCEIPLSAKNIPIGEKRKPGRPTKAKQALIVHAPVKQLSLHQKIINKNCGYALSLAMNLDQASNNR